MAVAVLAGAAAIVPMSSAFASPPGRSPAVPGSVGIRLVAVAGASPRNPLASSYVVERLAPGSRLTRQVEIDNDTDRSVDVSVYPAAASVVRGSFVFASGRSGNDLSSWTSVSQDVVRLARGSEAFDTLTINVPSSASSGERYAVLWAEVSAPPAGGITLVNRVGVRMYLSIGPGGAPPSNFAVGSLTAERSATGGSVVVAHVHNSGQGTLDLSGTLMLTDGPDGLPPGRSPPRWEHCWRRGPLNRSRCSSARNSLAGLGGPTWGSPAEPSNDQPSRRSPSRVTTARRSRHGLPASRR